MISSPRRANPFCKHRKDRLTRALPYFCRLQKVPSSNPSISISSNRSHPPRQCLETRESSSTSRPAARSWARSSWRWEACYVIFGSSRRRVFWAPKWTNLPVELSPSAYYSTPRLQWHRLQWHPAYSDTLGSCQIITNRFYVVTVTNIWLEWHFWPQFQWQSAFVCHIFWRIRQYF